MTAALKTIPALFPEADLGRLRQHGKDLNAEKTRLRKATREFEAFFMYYMLKTMRKTVPESPFSSGLPMNGSAGKDMFTDLFDMEVARRVSHGDSRSISAMLYDSMEPLLEDTVRSPTPFNAPLPLKHDEPSAVPLETSPLPIKTPGLHFIETPRRSSGLPISQIRSGCNDGPLPAYRQIIEDAARATKLDSALISAVIQAESAGNPRAVSKAGARGLMQLTDSTAQELGVADPFDPRDNIRAGSRYLRRLIDRYGDLKTALAAYNAGPGTVDRFGGIPPYRETQQYVNRVTRLMAAHRGLK